MSTTPMNSDAPADAKQPAQMHTPIQSGEALPTTPAELRELGNEVMRAGNTTKACHMYTLGIDMLGRSLMLDADGSAPAAELFALNASSGGELAKLLSNRSKAQLDLGDAAAAVEDASTCVAAEPSLEKGHMRLCMALEAASAPLREQLEAAERGLRACPSGPLLAGKRQRLAKAVAAAGDSAGAASAGGEGAVGAALLQTRAVADDEGDPRRAMAAADLGSAYAVGAYGLPKDPTLAERYLRIAAEGGDVGARRNLGLLLLEAEGRVEEAMHALGEAAQAGDAQAAMLVRQLGQESKVQEEEARSRLEKLAAGGDARAVAMLEELSRGQ